MRYRRMPIEIESPEQLGYANLRCNLAESSVSDATLGELAIDVSRLVLAYGDHHGKPELRELIAAQYPGISGADVLVTPGAAAALFIVHTALLEKDDRLVVQFPNYVTNLETPLAIGADVAKLELQFENGFRFSIGDVEKLLRPGTKLISITNPHNPTGVMIGRPELEALIALAERHDCFLLIDETYRHLAFDPKDSFRRELPPLAAALSDRVISVSSLSKASGLPGIRIGWAITKNKTLQETFLAAKEQIFISNSVVDEEIAFRYLQHPDLRATRVAQHLQTNFAMMETWMKDSAFLEWVKPQGGVVCFPRFRAEAAIDVEKFYKTLNENYGTFVGPGHWFGMDRRYMRIGFGWPGADELYEGLKSITAAAKASEQKNAP